MKFGSVRNGRWFLDLENSGALSRQKRKWQNSHVQLCLCLWQLHAKACWSWTSGRCLMSLICFRSMARRNNHLRFQTSPLMTASQSNGLAQRRSMTRCTFSADYPTTLMERRLFLKSTIADWRIPASCYPTHCVGLILWRKKTPRACSHIFETGVN